MPVLVGFRRTGAPLRRNPEPARKKSNLSIYPFDRRREGVDTWTFLLGCVRLVHRTMGNQHFMPSVAWFHARHPRREFSPLSAGTYDGVSGVGEAGRTSERYHGSHSLPTHSYTYIRHPCKFWWDSVAPEPRYGETLHPLEKSPTCRLPL